MSAPITQSSPCPICASPISRPKYTIRGHVYRQCAGCGGEHLASGSLEFEAQGEAYQGSYLGRSGEGESLSGYYDYEAEEALHRRNFQQNIAILKDFGAGPTLLDVGCATGHFLGVAQASGFEVAGLDRGEAAIQTVRERIGCPAWAGDVSEVDPGRSFDTITLWETLEHIPDPVPALAHIRERINPGGLLAIGTGDNRSPVAKMMGSRWWYRTPPDHCVIYNEGALRTVLARAGYRPLGFRRIPYHWVGGRNVMMKLLRSANLPPNVALRAAKATPNLPLPILHGITLVAIATPEA